MNRVIFQSIFLIVVILLFLYSLNAVHTLTKFTLYTEHENSLLTRSNHSFADHYSDIQSFCVEFNYIEDQNLLNAMVYKRNIPFILDAIHQLEGWKLMHFSLRPVSLDTHLYNLKIYLKVFT